MKGGRRLLHGAISNGWQSSISKTIMNKINRSASMKVSADNPAIASTLIVVRY